METYTEIQGKLFLFMVFYTFREQVLDLSVDRAEIVLSPLGEIVPEGGGQP